MNQYNQCFMLSFADSSIKSDTVYPSGKVGFGYPTSYHPLEVHNKVKCNFINVISVNQYHILTPLGLL